MLDERLGATTNHQRVGIDLKILRERAFYSRDGLLGVQFVVGLRLQFDRFLQCQWRQCQELFHGDFGAYYWRAYAIHMIFVAK